MADNYNETIAPNIGSEIIFIIGIGPGIWPIWQGTAYLAPYFQQQGLELVDYDASSWSPIFGGGITVRAIVRTGFSTMAHANAAAQAALRTAGFDVRGHVNVPLGSVLPDYPANEDLGPEDQSPDFLTGLAKTLGLSKSTLELLLIGGALLVGVVVISRR